MGDFLMPSLGADMEVGTILEWRVHPGDAVHRGDIVAVVDTEKSDIEVEVFEDGVVEELLVDVGQRGRGRHAARPHRDRPGPPDRAQAPTKPATSPAEGTPTHDRGASGRTGASPGCGRRHWPETGSRASSSPRSPARARTGAVVGARPGGAVAGPRRAGGAATPVARPPDPAARDRQADVRRADRRADGPLEAGDPALLPRHHHRPRCPPPPGSPSATPAARHRAPPARRAAAQGDARSPPGQVPVAQRLLGRRVPSPPLRSTSAWPSRSAAADSSPRPSTTPTASPSTS